MRIALFTETFLPKIDGIVTMLTKTVECLRKDNHEVLIFAPSGGPKDFFGAMVVEIPSMSFPLYPELRLAPPRSFMREKLNEFQPDILHLFEPALLGIGGLYYGAALRLPIVISYHTNLPAYLHHYKLGFLRNSTWSLMRARHRRADLNLCTSTAMIDDLRVHGVERLALWNRAVDSERFRPGTRSAETRMFLSQGFPEAPLLLYVGRLSAEKGIKKIREVLRALPHTRLAIVGEGPMRRELELYFRGTNCFFTGYLQGKALASAYASADVFVMPSETETLGLVLMEAMASGCPVVACRSGGIPDAVQDGITGFLFDPMDSERFIEGVRHALATGPELSAVRGRAREDAEQHGWQSATAQLLEYYRECIQMEKADPPVVSGKLFGQAGNAVLLGLLRRLLP